MKQPKQISQLRQGEKVSQVFLCRRKVLSTDRNGRRFLNVTLADRSGEMEALLWEDAEHQAQGFSISELVSVSGSVVLYQGRLQMHLTHVERADPTGLDLQEFFAQPAVSSDRTWGELKALLATLSDPHLSELAESLLAQEDLLRRFRLAPAARSIHHAYPGGLLEHTWSVVRLVDLLCEHYALSMEGLLNRDLCLLGAFLHDLGKVEEIELADGGLQYSDRGRLVGHVVCGLQILDRALQPLESFPPLLADQLRHMVLSHHGRLDHGSPKRPKIPEAVLVHGLDSLDSMLANLRDILRHMQPGCWTPFSDLHQRYFMLGWPTPAAGGGEEEEPDGQAGG